MNRIFKDKLFLAFNPKKFVNGLLHPWYIPAWINTTLGSLFHYPSQTLREVAYVKNLLIGYGKISPMLNILEWGSGWSTIYYPTFLRQKGIRFNWVSIEHNSYWFNFLSSQLTINGVELYLREGDYIEFPLALDMTFDIILIDGIKREDCFLMAAKLISPFGQILVHDIHGSSGLERIFWGMTYKKTTCPLSHSDLMTTYDRIRISRENRL